VCSSTEMGAPGASHLGTGDHGPKTDRSRPRSVPVNAAGSANSTLTVCRHVGLWPGGCPEPALRATDISWLPNVEKYRSHPSRRLFQDIGTKGFKFAADLAAIESFERQLRSYIRRSVRDSFSGDLTAPATLSNQQINAIVDRTYDEAWELMVTFGEAAG
jgi:hypothetical protein